MIDTNRILWLPTNESRHFNWDDGYAPSRNPSGVRINQETALQSTVVLACARVLAESVAGLPLFLLRRLADGGKQIAREHPLYTILHDAPNSWQTSFEWREQAMLHLCLHGNAYSEIRPGAAGAVTELWPLHPSRMKVERIENGRLRYKYREESGAETVYTQDQIMHLRWLSDDGVNGMVPIELARDAIGLARACEIHGAAFFGNGARPGVVLSTDNTISAEAAEMLRNNWERMHRGAERSNRTAVLMGGLKPVELGGNNQEAQFLEARRFQVEEICRLYRMPPHLVGDLTRSSFSNIEQQSIDFVQHTLLPWLRRFETAIARDLITDSAYFAEFDTRGLLRGDAAARASYYQTLWNLGVASINEIRKWENLDPVDGGDTRFVQLNMQTLDQANAGGVQMPAEEEPARPVSYVDEFMASRSMTISIDFDRTFTANPSMWGQFAKQSAEAGNRVVMVSRRPNTPDDQAEVEGTLGEYKDAFSDVLLVGDTMKDEAAKAAGINVDIWIDDSPQFIRSESRAAPDSISVGDFVSWGSGDGRGRGKIVRIVRDDEINVPDSSFTIQGTEDDPAVLITIYREMADGWQQTDTQVGHKASTLTKIGALA
jgi:HK97 family phage portal protein